MSLRDIQEELGDCKRCGLCEERTNIVFGSGDPNSPWMFLGEGPGRNEDLQGLPFVGRSGKLLDELLESAGWGRDDVYITNVVKCRPPNNRDPQENEILKCKPFLTQQIQSIKPVVITTLGKYASQFALGGQEPMGKMRGVSTEVDWFGHWTYVVPTYHPSYLLRGNKKARIKVENDIALALGILLSEGYKPPMWDKQ